MRDLKAVKDMRDSLRDDYVKLRDAQREIMGNVKHSEIGSLSDFDQKKISFIITVLGKLNIQINALTFVLNEDTYIDDVTRCVLNRYGINKEHY
jgi:hypothetical protein